VGRGAAHVQGRRLRHPDLRAVGARGRGRGARGPGRPQFLRWSGAPALASLVAR
jgi:hypothetical protein